MPPRKADRWLARRAWWPQRPEDSGLLRRYTCPWNRFRYNPRLLTRDAGGPGRAGRYSQTGPRLRYRAVLRRPTLPSPLPAPLQLPTRLTDSRVLINPVISGLQQ